MYRISDDNVYRIINNKLVFISLKEPEEILVFNDTAKQIFLSLNDDNSNIDLEIKNELIEELLKKGILIGDNK